MIQFFFTQYQTTLTRTTLETVFIENEKLSPIRHVRVDRRRPVRDANRALLHGRHVLARGRFRPSDRRRFS